MHTDSFSPAIEVYFLEFKVKIQVNVICSITVISIHATDVDEIYGFYNKQLYFTTSY
jgi:hypothetical protein